MSALLQQRSLSYAHKLRQQQHQQIFRKIRLQLLQDENQPVPTTQQGQHQILQAIESHRKGGSQLDFRAINNYVCGYEGNFHGVFLEEVVRTVMEEYLDNPHALASLANLLSKCREYQGVNCREMPGWIQRVLRSNIEGEIVNEHNLTSLCFLLYNLLTLADDTKMFEPFNYHLKGILLHIDLFSEELLIYLGEASNHRSLLPPQQLILQYLQASLPPTISTLALLQLSQLMQNYLRYQETAELHMPYAQWITLRLKSPSTPSSMRVDLIHLLTTLLHSQDSSFLEGVGRLEVWLQVLTLGRFGAEGQKLAALECLSVLATVLAVGELEVLVEGNLMLEVLIYGLEMELEQGLLYKMLLGVSVILEMLPGMRKIARGLGLLRALGRVSRKGSVKLTTVALDIRKMYED